MDYEQLKESWGEVEDRDGVRLSWNVFPSTRMVSAPAQGNLPSIRWLMFNIGGFEISRPHRCSVYPSEGEARHTFAAV